MQHIYGLHISNEKNLTKLIDGMQEVKDYNVYWYAYLYISEKLDNMERNLKNEYPADYLMDCGIDKEGKPVDTRAGQYRYYIIEYRHILCQLYYEMIKMPEFEGLLDKPSYYSERFLPETKN